MWADISPKEINLSTEEYLCLYTNGNYVGKFKTMEEVQDHIKKESRCYLDPPKHIEFMNYTVLSSTSINAINTNKEQ